MTQKKKLLINLNQGLFSGSELAQMKNAKCFRSKKQIGLSENFC